MSNVFFDVWVFMPFMLMIARRHSNQKTTKKTDIRDFHINIRIIVSKIRHSLDLLIKVGRGLSNSCIT